MDFSLSEEQEELLSIVSSVLEEESTSGVARGPFESASGYNETLWHTLCGEIGVASLAIPGEYGGAGYTYLETHLVLEALGRSLTSSPFFASVVLGAHAISSTASHEDSLRLLPDIASGSSIATLGWAAPDGRWNPAAINAHATPDGGSWHVSGEIPLVAFGAQADIILAFAHTPDGLALFELDAADLGRHETPAMDPALRFATITMENTGAIRLGDATSEHLDRLWSVAATALTALQVGGASRSLELTVAYAGQRVQFGRVIGSFQALKHRMAEMYVSAETAKTASRAAALAITSDSVDALSLAQLAKVWCSEAFQSVAGEMIQLHGGIAITWEHDAHLFFKRAHATGELLGSPRDLRKTIATELSLV